MKLIQIVILSQAITSSFMIKLCTRAKFSNAIGCSSQTCLKMSSFRATDMFVNSAKALETLGAIDNSLIKYLVQEDVEMTDGRSIMPRQVKNAHYTLVLPEPVPKPELIAVSEDCAQLLNLDLKEIQREEFAFLFAGNKLFPGLDKPYCTVYGCHSAGQWFGQLGDGRAIILGEVHNAYTNEENMPFVDIQELQLKGSGRSPYSRGFDGRAVLRSSIREFLVSEAMHHLEVPTTRALSLIRTGQRVQRPWYASTSVHNPYPSSTRLGGNKFPPDILRTEQGAIVCRVSPSFLRFGHLELFAKREDWPRLLSLLDYAIIKEFPYLLLPSLSATPFPLPSSLPTYAPTVYVSLFRNIAKRVAELVAGWSRVGYTQGNMNSDNTLLGGRTMDYGPFGFVEAYSPLYQPFTSDRGGDFCFGEQARAMGVNVQGLGETVFVPFLRYLESKGMGKEGEIGELVGEVRSIYEEQFEAFFRESYGEVVGGKLGLYGNEQGRLKDEDLALFEQLLSLMERDGVDYTIFFRELGEIDLGGGRDRGNEDMERSVFDSSITKAFEDIKTIDRRIWTEWFILYNQRLLTSPLSLSERQQVMRRHNAKYIPRNWMLLLAYEQAEKGDYSVLHELLELFKDPYAINEQQENELSRRREKEEKWYRRTPPWAQQLPGAAFMSCSS